MPTTAPPFRIPAARLRAAEQRERFACFGGWVTLAASAPSPATARAAIREARAALADVHRRLTRFDPASDLSLLNADPRTVVPAGPLVCHLAGAARWAGAASGGLVDATCLPAVEAAGYRGHFDPDGPRPAWIATPTEPFLGGWRELSAHDGCVERPVGLRLDSGGLGKGLAADRLAPLFADCTAWVVDCGGDVRVGGTAARPRPVQVADPHDSRRILHTLVLARGAAATSGTTRRAWAGGHHLVDPRTGRPADTGLIQVTAVAPTALEAEVRAKAALLSGPLAARDHLPDGGVLVTAVGRVEVVGR